MRLVAGRVAAASLMLVLVWPAAARADQGVAVDLGRVDVEEVLDPGQRYALPALGVRNPGSVVTSYVVELRQIEDAGLAVTQDWLQVSPASLTLAPNERRELAPVLVVPEDAGSGQYDALIAVRMAGEGDGARVGAAAATRLSFRVGATPAPAPEADRFGGDGWRIGLVVAMVVVGVIVPWRAGWRIRLERAP